MFGANAFGWPYFAQGAMQAGVPKSGTDANGAVTETGTLKAVIIAVEPGAIQKYSDFPLKFSSYNQLSASYQTYNQIATGGVPLPLVTETATIKFTQLGVDTNGSTTETATLVVKGLTATDANGTTTETGNLTVPVPAVTDANGVTTEVVSLVAKPQATDANGSVTESATVVVRLSVTDNNGSVTETQSLTVTSLVATDVNGYSEVVSLVVKLTISDVNSTTSETANFTSIVVTTDTNGVTTESVLNIVIAVSDAGTVTETTNVNRIAVDAGGISVETAFVNTSPVVADANGVLTESASVVVATTLADTNSVTTEAQTLVGKLTDTDAGTITESAAPRFTTTVTDTNGATTETAIIQTLRVGTDTNGPTTETVTNIISVATTSDTATAIEAVASAAKLTVYEPGALSVYSQFPLIFNTYNQIPATFGTYNAMQTLPIPCPQLVEVASAGTLLPAVTDSGAASETASIGTVALQPTDSATAVEAASVKVVGLITADSNGITIEGAGSGTNFSLNDATFSASESATVVVTPITTPDQATGVDSASMFFGPYVSDNNLGVIESASAVIQTTPISGSDNSGLVTESASVSVKLIPTDSGTISEVTRLDIQQFITVTETFAFLDSVAVVANVGSVDTSVGSDVAYETTTSTVADACAGLDTGAAIAAFVSIDTLVGTDVGSTNTLIYTTDVDNLLPSQWEMAAVTGGILITTDAGAGNEGQGMTAHALTLDTNAGISEISSTGILVAASDSNGSTAEDLQMKYTVTDVNGGIVEVTLPINAGFFDSDVGHASENTALRQWLPVTSDTNGGVVETVSTKAGLPLSDRLVCSEAVGLHALLYTSDNLQSVDEGHFIWKHIIPARPGRIMRRTRGEVFKPTTGETEIPGESVYRIAHGKTGVAGKRTRGEIKKTTSGRTLRVKS